MRAPGEPTLAAARFGMVEWRVDRHPDRPLNMFAPRAPSARLWHPPLGLSGCLRPAMMRDTRGLALTEAERHNYFPACAQVSLTIWMEGSEQCVGDAGFAGQGLADTPVPLCLGGPFTLPLHTVNPGPVHTLVLLFMADAWQALTGIDPGRYANRLVDAQPLLPADWLEMLAGLRAAPSDAQRLDLLCEFLLPRWQQAAHARPVLGHCGDWAQALALRAATSGLGRSLRQVERRVRAWAGLSQRELRGIARGERAFLLGTADSTGRRPALADIALEAGYADQSHHSREIKRFTGFSPGELQRRVARDEAFWVYRCWL